MLDIVHNSEWTAAPELAARPAPHNLEAEQALLGAIFVDNNALDRVGFLRPDHFYDPLHGQIFETMSTLIHAGKTATPITVKTFFEDVEPIDSNTTVPQYLGRLAANATTLINAAEYGRTIYDLATRRALIVISEDIANDAYDCPADSPAVGLVDEAEGKIAKLRAEEPTAGKPRAISAAAFVGKPIPAREWHVKDLIPARNVTMLGGDGGTGKSLLSLQLAVSTAAGRPWLGQHVVRGATLVISAEDDLLELHRRLADITADQNLSFESLSNLYLLSLAGEDAVLATFDKSNLMTKTAVCRNLTKLIAQIRPRLVVLDTLADLFGGDEINRSQTRQFISLLRGLALKFDTTVLLLAHPSVAGMRSGTGTSGSTAWSNSVRSRLYLDRIKEGKDGKEDGAELDPDARTLSTKKANYGPVGLSIPLRWHKGTFRATDEDAGPSEATASANVRAENAFLELLRIYRGQGRDVSPNHSRSYAPALFVLEDLGKRIGKPALAGAMNRLLSAGTIHIEEHGPPSKRYSRLVAS